VLRKHPANDVFVDVDAEGKSHLLRDTATAKPRVSSPGCNDSSDEFSGRSPGARFASTLRREQLPVFALHQQPVKRHKRCRFHRNRRFAEPTIRQVAGTYRCNDPVHRSQVGCTMPGAIQDQQLLFKEQRLCSDRAHPGPAMRAGRGLPANESAERGGRTSIYRSEPLKQHKARTRCIFVSCIAIRHIQA